MIDKLMNKSNMIGIDQTRKIGITIPELINKINFGSLPLHLNCLNLRDINGISATRSRENKIQVIATK
jgi:hypothetical protein